MSELPCVLTPVDPADLATVFFALGKDISADPRLVAVLLAQSALETGHWRMMRCFNFGNVKATDKWIEAGGGYTFFKETPPHAKAPVSETMGVAAAERNLRYAKPRLDEPERLDMEIGPDAGNNRVVCWFWPRHPQTRFRAFRSLHEGAKAWMRLLSGDRYRPALAYAARGDVAGYCRELKKRGPYFTEDLGRYTGVVQQLYRKYLPVAQNAADLEVVDVKEIETDPPPAEDENPYRTRPEDIALHPAGWTELSTGVEITSMPLADTGDRGPLFCRGSETARKWAEERGMRIASDRSYRELHRLCGKDGPGVHIPPHPLPDSELLRRHGIPRTREAMTRFLHTRMASQEWCTYHDEKVMASLVAIGWNGRDPVDNAGKHIDDDGDIIGWELHDGDAEPDWIQSESAAHRGHQQLDYATGVHLERDVDVPDSGPDTLPRPRPTQPGERGPDVVAWQTYLIAFFASRLPPEIALPKYGVDGHHGRSPNSETTFWTERWRALVEPLPWLMGFKEVGLDPATMPLRFRRLAWIGYQKGLGVEEIPGPRHDPRILTYSQHARRGGRFLGVDEAGRPLWEGGSPVPLPTDEHHWCAAFQSAATAANLLPGETPPHGIRIAVWELVADARAAGTLRPVEWMPTPGSLAVEGRNGQNPLHGGLGHIRAVAMVDGLRYLGLGSNEGNTIGRSWHKRSGVMQPDGHQLVCWIEV